MFTPIKKFTKELAKATQIFKSRQELEYKYRGIDMELVEATASAPRLWYIRMDKDSTNFNYMLATTYEDLAIWNTLNPSGAGESSEYIASKFEQDDTKVGGDSCNVSFEGLVATVTGTIDWIPAEDAWNQTAGNRVGFKITPSESLENYGNVIAKCGNKVYTIKDFNIVDEKSILIWLPLVTIPGQVIVMDIDWNGDGSFDEQFVVKIDPSTILQSYEEWVEANK